jgi:hypothetical protein
VGAAILLTAGALGWHQRAVEVSSDKLPQADAPAPSKLENLAAASRIDMQVARTNGAITRTF